MPLDPFFGGQDPRVASRWRIAHTNIPGYADTSPTAHSAIAFSPLSLHKLVADDKKVFFFFLCKNPFIKCI